MQTNIFAESGKSTKFIGEVPISNVVLSDLNPRRTWDDKHIDRLAQLIHQNGYDSTDAVKCYESDGKYHCFAGSNRLKACQRIDRPTVPVFLYEGYTEEELWRMAYDDNEQAGAQQRLCVVDVWEDYATKANQGWTQQKIQSVLNLKTQSIVSDRIKFSQFPANIKERFKSNESLKENHARELSKLDNCDYLNEVIGSVLSRSNNPKAKDFLTEVERYNRITNTINEWAAQLTGEHLDGFLQEIEGERSVAIIANAGKLWKDNQEEAEAEVQQWVIHGDSMEEIKDLPEGTKLIFTDPPYGMGYQSNRPTATIKKELIDNDGDLETALQTVERVMETAYPRMAKDSAVLMWCDWRSEPAFRDLLERCGFRLKNSIVWVKNNHGTGDLHGSFAPKHERLLFAVKGNPKFIAGRLPDVLEGSEFLDTRHPTPKPVELIQSIIETLTLKQEIVADPFMGTAPTGVAALRCGRRFWGCELKKEWWDEAVENVNKATKI